MAAFDEIEGARHAFVEALALDPDCVMTFERYTDWALSQAKEEQDFQLVVDLTTHGIRLDPDNVKLHSLRFTTLTLIDDYFPELIEGALLDLEAEDYAAVLRSDSSDEGAFQLKVRVDIKRGDLAAANLGVDSLRAAYPETWWLTAYGEDMARLIAQQRNEALPGPEEAQPSASPSPSVAPRSASSILARNYLKIAIGHADDNDMPRATQAATCAITMDPDWVLAYDCRACYLQMQGKSELALKNVKHALTLDPENTNILFGLATVYYRLGQVNRCQETLDLGLSIDEADVAMLELQSELQLLHATEERLLQRKVLAGNG